MIELEPNRALSVADAERIVGAWLGERVICSAVRQLTGGMVNTVYRLEFDAHPRAAVVKLHRAHADSFEREVRALHHLAAHTDCPVPEVYAYDNSAALVPHAYLLLEHIEGECRDGLDLTAADQADIDVELAGLLARLHRHTGNGWGRIGSDEPLMESWAHCFASRMVEVRAYPDLPGRLTPRLLERVDRLIDLVPDYLGEDSRSRLVHGDVWAGNLIVRRRGATWRVAALLDPDAQYADPEYELAYLEVFDADRRAFFEAYAGHTEIRSGYEDRRLLYWLHTALLHVALFDNPFFVEFTERTVTQIEQLR